MKIKAVIFTIVMFFIAVSANALPVSDSDLWEGAVIGTHSPDLNSTNGSSITGFFDGQEGSYGPETGNSIFASGGADSIHSIEWTTATEVTIQSINFVAYHDFDGSNINSRGIKDFTLFFDDGTDWIPFYEWEYANPNGDYYYGGGPSYQFDPDPHQMAQSYLELTVNLPSAITAHSFKADFTQYGASGSRIVELDAYSTLQPIPEPSTILLFCSGLIALAGIHKPKNKLRQPGL